MYPMLRPPRLYRLKKALFGEAVTYSFKTHNQNRAGQATAPVIGGNLSLLIAMLGSVSDMDYSGKILFLEDVGEYLYSVDRMLYTLKRAGKLSHLAGLIVGGFTEIKDNDIPFGFTVPDMVMSLVANLITRFALTSRQGIFLITTPLYLEKV
jgi:muramoyltetrapeptide carboxypeptidase